MEEPPIVPGDDPDPDSLSDDLSFEGGAGDISNEPPAIPPHLLASKYLKAQSKIHATKLCAKHVQWQQTIWRESMEHQQNEVIEMVKEAERIRARRVHDAQNKRMISLQEKRLREKEAEKSEKLGILQAQQRIAREKDKTELRAQAEVRNAIRKQRIAAHHVKVADAIEKQWK